MTTYTQNLLMYWQIFRPLVTQLAKRDETFGRQKGIDCITKGTQAILSFDFNAVLHWECDSE